MDETALWYHPNAARVVGRKNWSEREKEVIIEQYTKKLQFYSWLH